MCLYLITLICHILFIISSSVLLSNLRSLFINKSHDKKALDNRTETYKEMITQLILINNTQRHLTNKLEKC